MVLGGKYVTIVQGAVPGVAPEAAVPPVIGSVPPTGGVLESLADHNVVMVNTVLAAFRLKLCCIKLAVYGAESANCLYTMVAAPPGVRSKKPVVVAKVLGVPVPPTLVVPVYTVPAMV